MQRRRIFAPIWGLTAVAAATAVGLTTQRAGLVVITFLGTLWLPRLFGISRHGHCHGRHAWHGGSEGEAPSRIEERLGAWHRGAHGDDPSQLPASPSPSV